MRLIDGDALKKALVEHMDAFLDSDGRMMYSDHLLCGADYEDLCEFIDKQPTIHPEPHWIPVTEDTLPEEGRIVVVYGEKGTWDYGKYRGYGPNIHYWYWKNKTFKKVYWWMYKEDALPEPTKG